MFQPEGFTEVAKAIKEKSQKTIWCYTGYKFEDLIKNPAQAALLSYIDVLVDGRYKQTLRDESLLFRGSSNQRLIDVQASLNKKEVVKYKYNPFILGNSPIIARILTRFHTFVPNWFRFAQPGLRIKRESGVIPEQSRCCEALFQTFWKHFRHWYIRI